MTLKNGTLYSTNKALANSPRTGIWLSKNALDNFKPHILEEFSDRDNTTLSLTFNIDDKPKKTLISSLCLPTYDDHSSATPGVEKTEIVIYFDNFACNKWGIHVI
jgi:hypothetical protein